MANVIKDRVKENSTTTGTGNFTLSGAPLGFRSFSSVCSVGDTFRYAIQSIDSNGAPSGGWEVGIGTYSSANTLTRTTVIDSSNSGSVVDFSTGSKEVWIGMDATMAAWPRERLTAARTYYVRTDGSDSNNGLANTSGGAFLTIQKAVDVICGTLDLSTYDVTISVGDGTRTTTTTLKNYLSGGGTVLIVGNTSTPANCLISVTSGNCFTSALLCSSYDISGFKLATTTSGYGMLVSSASAYITFKNIDFGACASGHIVASGPVSVGASGNYSITGSAPWHIGALSGGSVSINSLTVTIAGTPNFSTAFCLGQTTGIVVASANTYTGSATGSRYNISLNAVVNTGGGGANYFPGNSAGTTATGGQYA